MKKRRDRIFNNGIFYLFLLFLVIINPVCVPRSATIVKGSSFSFPILYGANLSYKDLPKFLYAKKNLEKDGPLITLLDSKIFQGDFVYFGDEFFIFSLIKMINEMGVDAIIVDSDFVPIFQKTGRKIFDSSRFFLLASNLFKKVNEGGVQSKKTVFHPLFGKSLNGKGIFLLHTLSDGVIGPDYYLEDEVTFLKRRISLWKERTPLIGCIVNDLRDSFPFLSSFLIERPRNNALIRYQVTFTGNDFSVGLETLPFSQEDETLAKNILFFERQIDSFFDNKFVEVKETFSSEKLTNGLMEFILKETKADFFLGEREIVTRDWKRGKLSWRDIWGILREKGFLLTGDLSWKEIETLGKEERYLIFPKLQKRGKDVYRVVMTEGTFHHSQISGRRFSYLPKSLFELTIEFLTIKR